MTKLLMIDLVAERYGQFPHEVARLEIADFGFDFKCAIEGIKARKPKRGK